MKKTSRYGVIFVMSMLFSLCFGNPVFGTSIQSSDASLAYLSKECYQVKYTDHDMTIYNQEKSYQFNTNEKVTLYALYDTQTFNIVFDETGKIYINEHTGDFVVDSVTCDIQSDKFMFLFYNQRCLVQEEYNDGCGGTTPYGCFIANVTEQKILNQCYRGTEDTLDHYSFICDDIIEFDTSLGPYFKINYRKGTILKCTSSNPKLSKCEVNGNILYITVSSDEYPGDHDYSFALKINKHRLIKTEKKNATCTSKGNKAYWTCSICNRIFSDSNANQETTRSKMVIPAKGHNYQTVSVRATLTASGYKAKKCSVCNAVIDKVKYSYPKTFILSKTTYGYTGKVAKPTVTVKGADGSVIANTNYTLTYSNEKSITPGEYTVKVLFRGMYSGTKSLSYKIVPKETSIVSLTPAKKSFSIKWKKIVTETTGYQIKYATDAKFKFGLEIDTVKKNTITYRQIKYLKPNRKYYVRVRTYKTVNGEKYYSAWSPTKTVTTK